MKSIILVLTISFLVLDSSVGQSCSGAEIYTKESYQYGRFEVSMQSAEGDGIISSFFLYNKDAGCEWPSNNNEIDFEMTGNNNLIYMTSHHPGNPNPWFYGDTIDFPQSPHSGLNNYVIEWEPGIVRWFINDILVYVQDEPEAENLMYPMAIFMNIWPADFEDWVGVWNDDVIPRSAIYDYVKYYKYAPGEGNIGTENNYRLEWEDQFQTLDTSRWIVSEFKQLSNSYCDFSAKSVKIEDSKLKLTLENKVVVDQSVPVSFSVNMEGVGLGSNDKVYLNGSFNDWCGNCNVMQKEGDLWSLDLELKPGIYEFLFTINGWDVIGGAPAGSECDYNPCDEFYNYGFLLSEDAELLDLKTYCWSECSQCLVSSTSESVQKSEKKLIGIYDIEGRRVTQVENQILIYLYDDGTAEKRMIMSF